MNRVACTIAIAVAVVATGAVAPREARADEPATPPTDQDTAATERGDDEGGTRSTQSSRHAVVRVGALGAYRGLYDLSILGGGLALSIGGEGSSLGGHANLHFLDGRSTAGLQVFEWGVTGTIEWRVDSVRMGLGGGWTYFGVQRKTDGSYLQSFGPVALLRAGYEFGDRSAPFILIDCQVQLQGGGALVWGPTAQLGVKF
jgi:hypothetical protein